MATLGAVAQRPLTHRLLRAWHPVLPATDTTHWLQAQAQEAQARTAQLREYVTLNEAKPLARSLCNEPLTNSHNNR